MDGGAQQLPEERAAAVGLRGSKLMPRSRLACYVNKLGRKRGRNAACTARFVCSVSSLDVVRFPVSDSAALSMKGAPI